MSRPIQFSLVCILSLTTSCAFFAIQVSQAYAQQEGQSYEQSISEISIKIKDISRRLNANKALVASERDKLLGAEQALYKLNQSLQKIDYDLTRNQNQYKALGLQISLAKDSQTNNREGLKNLLISRYKQGRPDLIKQFLNQENPYAVGRLNNYYGYFSRALKIRFTLLAKQSSELLILEEEQSVAINRLEDERTKKTKLASVIVRSKQHRTSLIVKLDKKIVTNDQIIELFSKFSNVIKSYDLNIETKLSQIYRRNSVDLNCRRHKIIFDQHNVIPKFCFGCYKVQVEPKTILELIKLFIVFNQLKLEENNTRKCMIELRPEISGFYKGLIYCSGLDQANKIKEIIDVAIKDHIDSDLSSKIKRGCSEYPISFPD